jgi:hypothetical protein
MEAEPPKVEPPKRKRRWYQFSLRTLMIFTAIAAVACGLLGRKIEQKRRQTAAVEAIRHLGGEVRFQSPIDQPTEPLSPRWLLYDYFSEVESVSFVNRNIKDDDLQVLADLPRIKYLNLFNTRITDNGLLYVKRLTEIEVLVVAGTRVTSNGIAELQRASPNCYISPSMAR